MLSIAASTDLLADLELRHDEALRQLDELDRRVETALEEFQRVRTHTLATFFPDKRQLRAAA